MPIYSEQVNLNANLQIFIIMTYWLWVSLSLSMTTKLDKRHVRKQHFIDYEHNVHWINSLWPSDALSRRTSGWTLAQAVNYRLFSAKLLPEQMLTYFCG